MPNRNNINNNYRYAYQGQEKDPETGKEAFELRLWDSRIGRWLTTDPKHEFHSPYNGMGNDPVNGIDPDGGFKTKFGAWLYGLTHGGGEIGGHKGAYHISKMSYDEVFGTEVLTITSGYNWERSKGLDNLEHSANLTFGLGSLALGKINLGRLKKSGKYRVYSKDFHGNQHTDFYRISKHVQILGNIKDAYDFTNAGISVFTAKSESEKNKAINNTIYTGIMIGVTRYVPQVGVITLAHDIIKTTDEYQLHLHNAKYLEDRKKSSFSRGFSHLNLEFNQGR